LTGKKGALFYRFHLSPRAEESWRRSEETSCWQRILYRVRGNTDIFTPWNWTVFVESYV